MMFLPIQSNQKKNFQLYNGEWLWISNFIFEKAPIFKILGWYRVREVLLTKRVEGAGTRLLAGAL